MVKSNHVTLFFHLEEVVEIRQSESKTFFTLTDTTRNDVVLYGDIRGQLFDKFMEVVTKSIHPRPLHVVRLSDGTDFHVSLKTISEIRKIWENQDGQG